MSAKPQLKRRAEPVPRPADPRFMWNGLYWTAATPLSEFNLNVHISADDKTTPYAAYAVSRDGAASMTNCDFADPDAAAADCHRLADFLRAYLSKADIPGAAVEDDIPF
ncbi:MAG TPA: hypothetical protein PLW65_17995 [Pseudomonadota bacterium]|nr:hypothetical protein [Pseudomonadota bacterium]